MFYTSGWHVIHTRITCEIFGIFVWGYELLYNIGDTKVVCYELYCFKKQNSSSVFHGIK